MKWSLSFQSIDHFKKRIMNSIKVTSSFLIILSFCLLFSAGTLAQTGVKAADPSFTIENYYKVKWGYAEEFINLWKTNHYPLLKKSKEKGDLLSVVAEKPRLHSSEE